MSDFLAREFTSAFLEEADEHLQSVTRNLLAMEASKESDPARVRELLRSFHTLKGLCGMVGLPTAGDVSHAVESILHGVMGGRNDLTPATVELLFEAERALGALIATFRDNDGAPEAPPSVETLSLIHRLEALLEPTPPPAPTLLAVDSEEPLLSQLLPSELAAVEEARAAGRRVCTAVFHPSSDLAAKGVTINAVRSSLEEETAVIKVVPLLREGLVQFGFVFHLARGQEPPTFEGLVTRDFPQAEVAAPQPPPEDRPPHEAMVPMTSGTVRVEIQRLDEVMRLVGDLVVSRSRLDAVVKGAATDGMRDAVAETALKMERQLRALREAVVRARLVPLAQVFGRMPLAVRDMARQFGREVRLVLQGEDTQIDKVLVERLLDPIMHLVRNALAHGIETPADRRAAGKPLPADLAIRGRPEGDSIVITVSDDGRGIDLEQITRQARRQGLVGADETVSMSEVLDVICQPGFSTRDVADLGAGRGIGMDVVLAAVRSVRGSLAVESTPGLGTTFSLRLPLTMAIIDAFIVEVQGERYAVPSSGIEVVVEVDEKDIIQHPQGQLLPYRGSALPLVRLDRVFAFPSIDEQRATAIGLVSRHDGRLAAVVVDRVVALREVVVTSISDPLLSQEGVAGATELGDGRIALILDMRGVIRLASRGN